MRKTAAATETEFAEKTQAVGYMLMTDVVDKPDDAGLRLALQQTIRLHGNSVLGLAENYGAA